MNTETTDILQQTNVMQRAELESILINQVNKWELNGITQHSKEWHAARSITIGGSSVASIVGNNPFKTLYNLVREKAGLLPWQSNIKPQWGNLFEHIIARYVEHDRKCTIYAENAFIIGEQYISYSPDGLAVMDITTYVADESKLHITGEITSRSETRPHIVLLEFKCPYSRIPNNTVPKYYTPQVLMGLDVLALPTMGLYVEGVFRRCTLEQLDFSGDFDTQLCALPRATQAHAYGIVGFYAAKEYITTDNYFMELFHASYSCGDTDNDYLCNDLGSSSVELFTELMHAFDRHEILPLYSDMVFTDTVEEDVTDRAIDELVKYCKSSDNVIIGVLPWKLVEIHYHNIEPVHNYLAQHMPIIKKVMNTAKLCNDVDDIEAKYAIINANFASPTSRRVVYSGFSDGV